MNQITPEMARQELARREFSKRNPVKNPKQKNIGEVGSLEEALSSGLKKSLFGSLGNIGQKTIEQQAPQLAGEFTQGLSESVPQALLKGASGLSGLVGGPGIPQVELEQSSSPQRSFGRGYGDVLTSGIMAAPLAMGAEVGAGAALPGYIARAAGAGLSGAVLTPGDLNQRGKTGAEYAGATLGMEGLKPGANLLKSLTSKYKPKEAAQSIQGSYDTVRKNLSDVFNTVGKEAESRGVTKVPLDKSILEQIKEIGPQTKRFKKFVDKAKTGNYQDLRNLQSDLGKRAVKYKASGLGSENDVADELTSLRSEINDSIANHLEKTGHEDLSHKLKGAISGWKDLMETYHSHPTISKLVGPDRLVPKKLITTLSEDSTKMKKLVESHPEIAYNLKVQEHKNKLKDLIKMGLGLAAGGKYFFGGNPPGGER